MCVFIFFKMIIILFVQIYVGIYCRLLVFQMGVWRSVQGGSYVKSKGRNEKRLDSSPTSCRRFVKNMMSLTRSFANDDVIPQTDAARSFAPLDLFSYLNPPGWWP